ncbi:GPP34 family phosphoprotein [Motilibacter aurantiacus]|uniref:GPP34 family phosphoprotein n=1 Tax=Motilibacter aurantiacus TaxID=2714955 RepID=UPI001407E8E1|nr:GPP34 family phosphoprotein [Motilibacter aurantiacus]NHC45527.1 hypothetical protein [Motilibacter aurantiacus]
MALPADLPGDLLLLAVGERAAYRTRGPVAVALAGGMLVHDVLRGAPLGVVAGDRRGLDALLAHVAGTALPRVAAPLCGAGALAPHQHKVLGVFARRGYAVRDPAPRWQAERRLRAGLTPGPWHDPGVAALAVLAAVSGVARTVCPPPPDRVGRRGLADHLNALRWQLGPEASEVVLAVRRAYRRQGASGDSFVPSHGDGFGDSGGAGDGGGGDGGGGGGGD